MERQEAKGRKWLAWRRARSAGASGKVVGDILPENHRVVVDNLAAVADDAVDVNPALEAYFINLELFKMIKTALAELR